MSSQHDEMVYAPENHETSPLLQQLDAYGFIPKPHTRHTNTNNAADAHKPTRITFKSRGTAEDALQRGLGAYGWKRRDTRQTKTAASETSIGITCENAPATQPQGYEIQVSNNGDNVTVWAADEDGFFYAGITIANLVRTNSYHSGTHIKDHPRFTHRGIMLDVARSYIPLDSIRALITVAARLKFNVLHLHLIDDQAWRVEITNNGRSETDTLDYTQLHERSGQTAVSGGENPGFDDDPETTGANAVHDDPNRGYEVVEPGKPGWYTQTELKELSEFARQHQITIIPEIEFPGHNHSVLYAIPELATEGAWVNAANGPIQPWTRWQVGYSYLDYENPATWRFAEHTMRQFGEIFGFDFLHIGADECYKLIEAVGHGHYDAIVERVCALAHTVGFTTVTVWQEGVRGLQITHADDTQPPHTNDRVQLWNYTKPQDVDDLLNYARTNGARIINSDARHLYLDQKVELSDPRGLTWAVAEGLPTRQTYDWDPLENIPTELHAAVEGIETCLWGETVRTEEDMTYLMLPRMASIAEVAWTPQEKRHWEEINTRLNAEH